MRARTRAGLVVVCAYEIEPKHAARFGEAEGYPALVGWKLRCDCHLFLGRAMTRHPPEQMDFALADCHAMTPLKGFCLPGCIGHCCRLATSGRAYALGPKGQNQRDHYGQSEFVQRRCETCTSKCSIRRLEPKHHWHGEDNDRKDQR